MNRPEVRIIQNQEEEVTKELQGYEAEEILKKYGYSQQFNNIPNISNTQPIKKELTFDEMLEEKRKKEEVERINRLQKINGPKPITFDGKYDSEVKYGSDDEFGIGFKIEITSDMKLPK